MTNREQQENTGHVLWSLRWYLLISWLVVIGLLVSAWGGCWQSGTAKHKNNAKVTQAKDKDETREEKEEKQKDFEIERLSIQPSDDMTKIFYVKPGHWTSAVQTMRANNFDFRGELNFMPTDINRAALPIDRTPFRMLASRPVAMPKGQTKHFDLFYYIPHPSSRNPILQSSLHPRKGGRIIQSSTEFSSLMKPHQFYFVVLAREPESYGFLTHVDSVRPPNETLDSSGGNIYYHVMLPKVERQVPLPECSLAWTNIAYLLWDDFDVSLLTRGQQQALLDWLHWGGQLIVSGPRSVDGLKNSFLDSYLPITSDATSMLDQESLSTLNKYWSLKTPKGKTLALQILPEKPIPGIKMQLAGSGTFTPHTGQHVAERKLGRGRLIVTAFPISQRELNNWGSFDSFLNGCLMRHPPRKYTLSDLGTLQVTWAKNETLREDPRLLSNVRYFSRDAAGPDKKPKSHSPGHDPDPSHQHEPQSGIAGWNDFSTVSNAARLALKKAAGISIPDAGFVMLVLFAYLVILVPVNWALFRTLGRVEWAWVAAPLIAISCAIIVVKLAQLDIGFARSRTEIATLELQSDYERAHLTRYTALYSSLASSYDIEFDDHAALALPFATTKDYQLVSGQTHRTVRFHRGSKAHLTGFRVDSNATGMLHSEYFVDTGGPLRLHQDNRQRWVVTNDTQWTIHDVGVVFRQKNGRLDVAWVGNFAPQIAKRLNFSPAGFQNSLLDEWELSPVMSSSTSSASVSLRHLVEVAQDRNHLRAGEMRLVGWTDEDLPGMSIQPKSSQNVLRTLVIAHLNYGTLTNPEPDVNARPKVQPMFDFETVDNLDGLTEGLDGLTEGLDGPTEGKTTRP